jgi:hypothetical protein
LALITSRKDIREPLRNCRGFAVDLPEEPEEGSVSIQLRDADAADEHSMAADDGNKEAGSPKEGEVPAEYQALLDEISATTAL